VVKKEVVYPKEKEGDSKTENNTETISDIAPEDTVKENDFIDTLYTSQVTSDFKILDSTVRTEKDDPGSPDKGKLKGT
jgi:hypothetical protein